VSLQPHERASGRTLGQRVDLDYGATRAFFEARAESVDGPCPWTATMYHDRAPVLTEARDRCEKEFVLPLLSLQPGSRVLDIGCGIGRWAVAIAPVVASYTGIDFAEGLLWQARAICAQIPGAEKAVFELLDARDVGRLRGSFDRVVLAGILQYLNDDDAHRCLEGVASLLAPDAVVYVREPMRTTARLTLDRHWSDDLETDYSTIYRTISEYEDMLGTTLGSVGMGIQLMGDLYPPELEHRIETRQRVMLLAREDEA
jgi:cyclopropane fatty-acyl-phospholipid synthase-like methyltransferase